MFKSTPPSTLQFMSSIALIFQAVLRRRLPILEANAEAGGTQITSRQRQSDWVRPHIGRAFAVIFIRTAGVGRGEEQQDAKPFRSALHRCPWMPHGLGWGERPIDPARRQGREWQPAGAQ